MPPLPSSSAPPADRPPRLAAIGFHRLKGLLQELAPAYADRARVEVLDKGFDDAVAAVRALQREGALDVVVAAGSNGAFLRQHLELPVVQVKVGGFDVMRALVRARGISSRVALVTYGDVAPEVQSFNELYGLGVEARSYRNEEEASACVHELQARGIEVIVAPGLVADLADEAGLVGVFLYSEDAVREALDDAVEIARAARIEQAKRERLNTILGHLHDGVVAVDAQERIETLNPVMARLLGAPPEALLGRRLSDVAPEIGLRHALSEARTELEAIARLGQQTLVLSRMPIVEQGVRTGAVAICQDPDAIQRVDRHLRARRRPAATTARYELAQMVGGSTAVAAVREQAQRCAGSDATLLVIGESGTGKELLAQGVHNASRRRRQPFIAVNCAAFPETLLESELFGYEEGAFTGSRRGGKAGLFEAAHTGTIFLDEIGEMPLSLQTRLLRVLQEREILRIGATEPTPIDVRVIAATHRDLPAMVAEGGFRRDLYYRLNILLLRLPPLRERLADLPGLAAHLHAKVARRLGVPEATGQGLVAALVRRGAHYAWPGNVRELENLVERLIVGGQDGGPSEASRAEEALDEAQLRALAPEVFEGLPAARPGAGPAVGAARAAAQPVSLDSARQDADLRHVLAVLDACQGDKARACEQLGISRTTLWRKLRQAGAAGR